MPKCRFCGHVHRLTTKKCPSCGTTYPSHAARCRAETGSAPPNVKGRRGISNFDDDFGDEFDQYPVIHTQKRAAPKKKKSRKKASSSKTRPTLYQMGHIMDLESHARR